RLVRPEGSHLLVGLPAEQVGRCPGHPRAGLPAEHLVAVARAPASVREATLPVFVGGTEALHDAVEGQELDHGQPSHSNLSPSRLDSNVLDRNGTVQYPSAEMS